MKATILRAVLALAVAWPAWAGAASSAEPPPEKTASPIAQLPWQNGPGSGKVGDIAALKIPADGHLLPESHGARFLELTGNLPEPGQTVLVYGDWWATFGFERSGYIKDDEKLDADALLASLKENDGPSNEERTKRGFPKIHTVGWAVPPHYDPGTRQLEWGLELRSEDSPKHAINYTMRLLGRSGYESVVLVTGADTLQKDIAELRGVLKGFDFNAGERYSEFKQGDRVAEYGLGALVLGGAAAAAAKTGIWKPIVAALAAGWKLVAAALVAVFAGIGKLFKRKAS